MSSRAMGWLLFGALVIAFPLPLFGLEGSLIPVARYAELGLALLVLIALEGAGGMVGVIAGLLWAHALVYGVLLFVASRLVARWLLARLPEPARAWVVGVVIVLLFAAGELGGIYETQFHHAHARARLGELYR